MARKKAQGVFVVTPTQFEAEEAVQGLSFPTAQKAVDFATQLQKAARRIHAKLTGTTAKLSKASVPLDILMQPTEADGTPIGEPVLYDSVGVNEDVSEDESNEDEDED